MSIQLFFNKPVSGAFSGSFSGSGAEIYGVVSASHAVNADTASYVEGAGSASWAATASYALGGEGDFSGSFTGTFAGDGSGIIGVVSASHSVQADTASVAQRLDPNAQISASQVIPSGAFQGDFVFDSNVHVSGTVYANELHTNVISASIIFSSGSTIFGDTMDDTHLFTGSVSVTGSMEVSEEVSASAFYGDGAEIWGVVSASHSVQADTASLAESASYATTASYAETASYVETASFADKAAVAPLLIHLNNNFGADLLINPVPVAYTEWDEGQRVVVDLTGYTQARVIVRVNDVGSYGPTALHIEASLDELAWFPLCDVAFQPSASLSTIGTIAGAWADITGTAQTDVFLRWGTVSGSGTGTSRTKLGSINLAVK